jgi:hypothetical protein
MGALRACYEAVEWWKLAPRPSALISASPGTEAQRPQVSGDGVETFVIYLPAGFGPDFRGTLGRFARNAEYEAWWCDPRSGNRHRAALEIADDRAGLPPPPTGDDWLLFVRRKAS